VLHIYIHFMSEASDYGTLYLPFANFLCIRVRAD
jgi:hypothetical protein